MHWRRRGSNWFRRSDRSSRNWSGRLWSGGRRRAWSWCVRNHRRSWSRWLCCDWSWRRRRSLRSRRRCWFRSHRWCRSRRNDGRLQTSRSCGSFLGGFFCCGRCFRGGILLNLSLNRAAYFLRDVYRDGTRVRLFLRDAEAGQKVNNGLGFDFELAGQLVNSDLIGVSRHALRSIPVLQLRIRFGVFLFGLRDVFCVAGFGGCFRRKRRLYFALSH